MTRTSNSEKFQQTYKQIFENCTCMHIRKTARAITQYYDAILAPAGISSTQLTLLVTIYLNQSRIQAQNEICGSLGVSPSSLTRTLKPLFEQDLIENDISENKKNKHLVLTERGMRTLRLAAPLWENAQEELVAKIGESDWHDLIEKLAIVTQVPATIVD